MMNKLIQRVQDILLKPKDTWPVIDAEPADTQSIYKNYLIYLAAIPALASFIGLSLVGVGGFGYSVRVPLLSGLMSMVVTYVLALVMVFVMALIVDALAPTFGGTKSQINALKLIAYGSTASFVGGIFNLVPALGVLGLLAALYSVYLIYTGIPVLMKCPQDKAVGYTAVVIVCGIVAGMVIGALSRIATPSGPMSYGSADGHGEMTIKTPGGELKIDTAKMEAMTRKMEEAGKQMEKAQASGDQQAAGQAAGAMMAALTGGNGQPIPAADLKALLPESIGSLKRQSFDAQSGGAMGISASTATSTFADGDKHVSLAITDLGGMGGLMSVAAWSNLTVDRETSTGVEKVYKAGKRTVREAWQKDGSHGEYIVILENGVMVEGKGDRTDIGALKAVVASVNLDKLEAMKRPAQ